MFLLRLLWAVVHALFAKKAGSVEPPTCGKVVASPEVGGLHYRYTRRAA